METLVAESETAPKIELFQVVVENPESEEEVCLMNQVLVENEEEDEEEIQMVVESANTPSPDTGICLTNKAFSEEDNNSESCSPVKITDLLSLTPPPPPPPLSTSVAATLLVPAPPSSTLVPAPPPPPPPSSITSTSAAVVPVSSSSITSSTGDVKKALYKFGQRTSNFRGVTRHRWTGKFEAHLWDNTSISETRKRKGKQVYLGGYETEEKAAVAYDLAALKFWGAAAHSKLNFPISKYEKEIEEMIDMSKEEYINSLRRQSICFARGNSNYRGVTRQHEGRRWQARIGRVAGGRDIYLGTYDTEEEAAEAYDIAAVKLRGMGAITNFHISNYYKEGSKELDILPISAEEEQRPPPPPVRIRRFKITTA